MEWQTLLWIGGLMVLFFVMMRGCGGMAGGGCGAGSRRRDTPEGGAHQQAPGDHDRAA